MSLWLRGPRGAPRCRYRALSVVVRSPSVCSVSGACSCACGVRSEVGMGALPTWGHFPRLAPGLVASSQVLHFGGVGRVLDALGSSVSNHTPLVGIILLRYERDFPLCRLFLSQVMPVCHPCGAHPNMGFPPSLLMLSRCFLEDVVPRPLLSCEELPPVLFFGSA